MSLYISYLGNLSTDYKFILHIEKPYSGKMLIVFWILMETAVTISITQRRKLAKPLIKCRSLFFRSIHSDFQWSCNLRDYLKELCALLNVTYGMPDNYVPTRWLSVFDGAKDSLRMIDVYTLFYINFVGDRKLYQFLVVDIMKKKQKLVKRVAIESRLLTLRYAKNN